MRNRTLLTLLFCCLAVAVPLSAAGTQPQLHVGLSKNVDPADATPENLANIFLGNKRHWSDGSLVKLAVLASSERQRDFLSVVTDRSPSQFWAYWRNRVFSGRGIMPKIFDSNEEMLRYLEEEKGAIGQITDVKQADRSGAATVAIGELSAP